MSSAYVIMPAFEVFDNYKSIEDEMPGTELKPKSIKVCPSCQTENKKMLKHVFPKVVTMNGLQLVLDIKM